MKRILIIDDEPSICLLLSNILRKAGFVTDTTLSGNTALKMIKEKQYGLVFCDYRLKDKEKDGDTLLQGIQDISPGTTVAIMTGYPDVRIAIRMIKEGAYDYLEKPFTADRILALAHTTLGAPEQPVEEEMLSNTAGPIAAPVISKAQDKLYIYGTSDASKELYVQIALVAPTDYSVVICGETGTGKEAVARLIHLDSKRSKQPFVALDCGCLSDELAASELFGHEKGAFTGASDATRGAFRQADGGTLFLDEISNLDYQVQTALLRVVQERVVRPVGSLQEIPVDIRIIAASNEDLGKAVASGKFRQDLFYRLNEFNISVPPLRERQQDLPLFINAFLEDARRKSGGRPGRFSDEAMACLLNYLWPGNIRELNNVIRRAELFAEGAEKIAITCLPPEITGTDPAPTKKQVSISPAIPAGETNNLKSIVQLAEYQKIISIMKTVRYNKTEAARLLNIDRKTLYNKLHLLNIEL
jgi:two-component system response regulator HydG